jgi:hypothetical protein
VEKEADKKQEDEKKNCERAETEIKVTIKK